MAQWASLSAQTVIALLLALASTALTNIAYLREHDAAAALPTLSLRRPLHSVQVLLTDRSWLIGFALAGLLGLGNRDGMHLLLGSSGRQKVDVVGRIPSAAQFRVAAVCVLPVIEYSGNSSHSVCTGAIGGPANRRMCAVAHVRLACKLRVS